MGGFPHGTLAESFCGKGCWEWTRKAECQAESCDRRDLLLSHNRSPQNICQILNFVEQVKELTTSKGQNFAAKESGAT